MSANKVICFFNTSKTWGGGEKWHYEMAAQMTKNEYSVVVFSAKNSELSKRLKSSNIKFFELNVSNLSFLNLFKILKISRLFKMMKINTIILNLSSDLKFAGICAKIAKIKNIIYRRGSAIPIKNSLLNKFLFRKILTGIIANTEETKKTINQKNNKLFSKDKIKVIYNGIDIDNLDKQLFKKETKQQNQIIIGNIGRLVKQKAQFYLIELAKILKNKKINFKIIIGGEGKLENELKILVKNAHLENEIVFSGFVSNIKEFLENIDIFVLTSIWEGFGYVLVEAMACKKPVLAFNVSSNPEIIKNNETGFLVQPFDIEQLADKIEMFSINRNLIEEIGIKARQSVENYFTFQKSFNEFEQFIKQLI